VVVVTVKFQGEMPAWSELDTQVYSNHGKPRIRVSSSTVLVVVLVVVLVDEMKVIYWAGPFIR
jgi:hypothetical protein